MPKRPQAKKTTGRHPKQDDSQTALSVVERAIGGKLVDQSKKRRQALPKLGKAAKA
jgi:hypothetical protein